MIKRKNNAKNYIQYKIVKIVMKPKFHKIKKLRKLGAFSVVALGLEPRLF